MIAIQTEVVEVLYLLVVKNVVFFLVANDLSIFNMFLAICILYFEKCLLTLGAHFLIELFVLLLLFWITYVQFTNISPMCQLPLHYEESPLIYSVLLKNIKYMEFQ